MGTQLSRIGVVIVAALVFALLGACKSDEGDGEPTATASDTTAEPSSGDSTGVSDTEIKLGTHMPLSQTPAAAYSIIADGMKAYFDYINETEGGVDGRKITLLVGDDHYSPPDTLEVVRRLVEQDKVFGIIGGLGEATHFQVWEYLAERGVPDLFISSGIEAWTDPVVKTRFGGNPVYSQEGAMLGQYIAEQYPGKKLGLLVQDDDFGHEGEAGIRTGIEGSDVEITTVETYDPANLVGDVTGQTQRLKNEGVDVVAAYALPSQAASLIKTAREVLNWDVPIVISGVNASDAFVQLAGVDNAEGVVTVLFGHQAWETDDPGVRQFLDVMETYAPGASVENFSEYGYIIAELTVEALKRVGPDLTREALVEELESMRDYQCSLCFAPNRMSPTDHRPFEVERYVRLEDGNWVPFGDLVDFESTPE
jgi:ABC-type branched-subunit amino acid transport system substrate-binding protein